MFDAREYVRGINRGIKIFRETLVLPRKLNFEIYQVHACAACTVRIFNENVFKVCFLENKAAKWENVILQFMQIVLDCSLLYSYKIARYFLTTLFTRSRTYVTNNNRTRITAK